MNPCPYSHPLTFPWLDGLGPAFHWIALFDESGLRFWTANPARFLDQAEIQLELDRLIDILPGLLPQDCESGTSRLAVVEAQRSLVLLCSDRRLFLALELDKSVDTATFLQAPEARASEACTEEEGAARSGDLFKISTQG